MSTHAPKYPRPDPTTVRAQIDALRASHPSIWEEDDDALVADMLEAETELLVFLGALVNRMNEATAYAAGLDYLISSLVARRERFNGREEAIRALVFKMMTWAEVRKIELPQATLSIRTGQPKVIITDEAALPDHLVRVKREPAKTLIRELIDQGVDVPGAQLSNAEPFLSVRVK
jgi:hypothetical protein